MNCNRQGCKTSFHVTCAQLAGLLCEEAGNYQDNVKYCGYCDYHYQKIVSCAAWQASRCSHFSQSSARSHKNYIDPLLW